AALTRRITPSVALSPAFMAVFMSSVRRVLSMGFGIRDSGFGKAREPATHWARPAPGYSAAAGDQYRRWRLVTSREVRRAWRFTAAAALRLRSWVGFS